MESKGHKYNKFLRRFRQKMKPSFKVYGKKDRRQNRNAHKGDDLSANYVKAGDARRIPNGKKQTGQWVRPTVEPSTKPLSRVLFTDESGSNIHLHAGDEARGTVCDRFLRAHRATKQNKILFDEPQQARMVIQKNPKNFPLKSLRRIASILESHIRSLEWSQYNKKNAEGRK